LYGLGHISFDRNRFSGEWHADRWVLPAGRIMSVADNNLTGSLDVLCSMHAPILADLDLSDNSFSGPLAPCIPANHPSVRLSCLASILAPCQ
jgi:hypothetical protein